MIELTLGDVAALVGGTLAGGADPRAVITGSVEFDSRKVGAGDLFVAFSGEHQDGHDFVAQSLASGAVAAVVTRPVSLPSIEVPDALTAFADLAHAVVVRLSELTVVGVTGSSGKTSTKDLLAQVLAPLGPTVAPPGSFNNELGYPYTVLRADRDTRFLVLEASARGIGHIRYLTAIAPPRIGVVLNVGSAHLGEFGSSEAIAAAKGELVEALPAAADGGLAVLNGDDEVVAAMAARTRARVVRFGRGEGSDIRASEVRLDSLARPTFVLTTSVGSIEVTLRHSGEHQIDNAVAAAAVALECGMSLGSLADALSRAEPLSRWRMELAQRADGVLIVNDSYNANPESMGAALRTLATMGHARSGGRTWAVLGQMAELGQASAQAHAALGRMAGRLAISRLIVVGEQARPIADAAVLESWPAGRPEWVPDASAAIELLQTQLRPADVVLVKASRSAGLEQIALALAGSGREGEGQP